jgi:hypothetical protein
MEKHFLKKSVSKKHKKVKKNIKKKTLRKKKVLRTNSTLLKSFNQAITNPASINPIIIKSNSVNQAIINPASIIIK